MLEICYSSPSRIEEYITPEIHNTENEHLLYASSGEELTPIKMRVRAFGVNSVELWWAKCTVSPCVLYGLSSILLPYWKYSVRHTRDTHKADLTTIDLFFYRTMPLKLILKYILKYVAVHERAPQMYLVLSLWEIWVKNCAYTVKEETQPSTRNQINKQ